MNLAQRPARSRAHLPRAAQGTAETGRPPRGRDHAAGAEGAGEIRPKQKLYVAVPDRRGRRTPYCAVWLQAGQESQERGGIPGGLLRVSPRGRVPGLPQAAAGHPCSGMLGPLSQKYYYSRRNADLSLKPAFLKRDLE